jgi:hypothetical protein
MLVHVHVRHGHLQHDFNAAKTIYVTDVIDFLNAAHEYSVNHISYHLYCLELS